MSRTIRSNNRGWYRRPKGHKAALIRGDRNLVPSCREELNIDNEAKAVHAAMTAMVAKGYGREEISKKLATTFGLTYLEAVDKVDQWDRRQQWAHDWSYTPETHRQYRERIERQDAMRASVKAKIAAAHYANEQQQNAQNLLVNGASSRWGSYEFGDWWTYFAYHGKERFLDKMARHAGLTPEETNELMAMCQVTRNAA